MGIEGSIKNTSILLLPKICLPHPASQMRLPLPAIPPSGIWTYSKLTQLQRQRKRTWRMQHEVNKRIAAAKFTTNKDESNRKTGSGKRRSRR